MSKRASQLLFLERFPRSGVFPKPQDSLLIYDRKLERLQPEFKNWARRFPHRYGVDSGETLKDLRRFADHAEKLARLARPLSARSMTVIAVGGGSVGDFAGFFAGVYKRGVSLVHVPSTWLAAIDSSHGGKTALNIDGVKNQIGSFYPARKVVIVRSLLSRQSEARIQDAMGELGKIALIDGGSWVKALERSSLRGEALLWKFLKPAINAKLRVVARDPREETGLRQILNFGHTIGHVLESAHGWSHGFAVAQGLYFALDYSLARAVLSPREHLRAQAFLYGQLGLRRQSSRPLTARRFTALLLQDKKSAKRGDVTFVFLRRFGRCERQAVSVRELTCEARRQGLLR